MTDREVGHQSAFGTASTRSVSSRHTRRYVRDDLPNDVGRSGEDVARIEGVEMVSFRHLHRHLADLPRGFPGDPETAAATLSLGPPGAARRTEPGDPERCEICGDG